MQLRNFNFIPWFKASKPEPAKQAVVYANHISRVSAYIIDTLVSSIITGAILKWFLQVDLPTELAVISQNPMLQIRGLSPQIVNSIIIATMSYYTICLVLPWQATIGQLIMGIVVVSVKSPNGKILPSQALMRFLLSTCLVIPTGIGLLTIMATKQKVAVHDWLCETRVVFRHPTVSNATDTFGERQMQKLWQQLMAWYNRRRHQ